MSDDAVTYGFVPRDGVFYVMRTLLACDPGQDRNKRFVYCWPSDVPVLVMNDEMRIWGKEDDVRLSIIVTALNGTNVR